MVALPAVGYYPTSKFLDTIEALDEISLVGIPDGRAVLVLGENEESEDLISCLGGSKGKPAVEEAKLALGGSNGVFNVD